MWGLEESGQTGRHNRADAAERVLCCIPENPERVMGTLDPRKEFQIIQRDLQEDAVSLKGCLREKTTPI